MSQDRPLDNLDEVARRLRSLEPAGRIDRDRVMYLAGQQSAAAVHNRRDRWAWPAAAISTAVAVALAVLLGMRPDVAGDESEARIKSTLFANGNTATEALDAIGPSSHSRLRRDLLFGVWPEHTVGNAVTPPRDSVRPRRFEILDDGGLNL
jgi:hypothetical protein